MNYAFNVKNIASRLPKTAPAWMPETIATAAALVDRLSQQAVDINKDPRLSSQGRTERKQALLAGGIGAHLNQLKARVKTEASRIEAERAGLTLPQPDRTDLFAEMQRQERRQWLRSLPEAERGAYLLTEDDRKRLSKAEADRLPPVDALTLQAILTAPASISGMAEPLSKRLHDAEVRKLHGATIDRLTEESDAIANVDAALQVAEMTMVNEVGQAPERVAA